MINLTIQDNYLQFGGVIKQSDVVSGSAYMHMFSSAHNIEKEWKKWRQPKRSLGQH